MLIRVRTNEEWSGPGMPVLYVGRPVESVIVATNIEEEEQELLGRAGSQEITSGQFVDLRKQWPPEYPEASDEERARISQKATLGALSAEERAYITPIYPK